VHGRPPVGAGILNGIQFALGSVCQAKEETPDAQTAQLARGQLLVQLLAFKRQGYPLYAAIHRVAVVLKQQNQKCCIFS
jgi:hypothetical protein